VAADIGDVKRTYDRSADVLYVYFDEEEPSYTEEVDGVLFVDIGRFSGKVTGFSLHGCRGLDAESIANLIVALRRVSDKSGLHVESLRTEAAGRATDALRRSREWLPA